MPVSYSGDPRLDAIATGREASLFDADMAERARGLAAGIAGKRVLVLGGAGSIGTATVHLLLEHRPAAVHVVDIAENALAELTRDLRARAGPAIEAELRFLPLDLGSAAMERVLHAARGYDLVLHFAAQKHVRGEKDLPSLLQMLDTNVVKTRRLLRWLARHGHRGRCFCVSTDKAADPTSLMGASKRLMEAVLFRAAGDFQAATAARFANVAFSDGSLLQSFLIRLARRQPLAVPRDTRRYFISAREAAQICLLAAVATPTGLTLFPKMDPQQHLRPLVEVAQATLAHFGYRAAFQEDPETARGAVEQEAARGAYPVLLTPLDTSGEKPYEEFVSTGEVVRDVGFRALSAVRPADPPAEKLDAVLDRLERAVSDARVDLGKAEVAAMLADVVPGFRHVETGRSLDDRI